MDSHSPASAQGEFGGGDEVRDFRSYEQAEDSGHSERPTQIHQNAKERKVQVVSFLCALCALCAFARTFCHYRLFFVTIGPALKAI